MLRVVWTSTAKSTVDGRVKEEAVCMIQRCHVGDIASVPKVSDEWGNTGTTNHELQNINWLTNKLAKMVEELTSIF